ncbi:NfeD family protein [Propionibacteriaceae bacterium G1746]|uniref:NfeD family protein n=1 Tax=Aestuariimicrobium sp. G57 TaxID=3418485 RepID=UPI003C1B2FC3
MEFLVIGTVGLVVLVVAVLIGEFFDVPGHGGPLDSDVLSLASISAFIGAFGFGGAIAQQAAGTLWVSVPVGIAMGLLFSWFTIWFTRKIKNLRTDEVVRTSALVGHEARVLTAIPADGYGEITLSVSGHLVKYSAKAAIPVEAGQRVWISNVLSATAVEVSPTDAIGPGPSEESSTPPLQP